MNQRTSARSLPQRFLLARERLMTHFRPILNHYGLTEQQWRILRMLHDRGQLEPRELCMLCQILSSNMAGVLARMKDTGLIERQRSAEDQRRVLVRLTRKGEKLFAEIAPHIEQQYRYIEKAFPKQVLRDLDQALERFLEVDLGEVERVELP